MREFTEVTGYLMGSKVNKEDIKRDEGDGYYFEVMLNQMEKARATPLWETYKIFTNDGMVMLQ